MNAGPLADRVYAALKRQLLSGRHIPGERLDPAAFTDSLGSSITPIRDALNRLTGEGLVETRGSGGFHLPGLSEPVLQDRYEWTSQILLLVLRGPSPAPVDEGNPEARPESAAVDAAGMVAGLFSGIARCSGNGEHHLAIAGLNDRLHAARLVEARVIPGAQEELRALAAHWRAQDNIALRKAIAAYHKRRRRASSGIMRELYRRS